METDTKTKSKSRTMSTENTTWEDPYGRARMTAPVMAEVPWYTTAVSQTEKWKLVMKARPEMERFILQLQGLETRLLTWRGGSKATTDMQRWLSIEVASQNPDENEMVVRVTQTQSQREQWNPTVAGKVCALLCAYRLVDVASMMTNTVEWSARIPRRLLGPDDGTLECIEKLHDWPRTLFEFRGIMQRMQRQTTIEPHATTEAIHDRLLRFVSQADAAKTWSKVMHNFAVAAMQFSYITNTSFAPEAIPDLPDKFEHLVAPHDYKTLTSASSSVGEEAIGDEVLSLSEKQVEMVNILSMQTGSKDRKKTKSESLNAYRSPLQLAATISPLFLLLPLQLIKKSWNRNTIIQTTIALGNDKPDLLVEVERALWSVVFGLAQGGMELYDGMQALMTDLPWDRLLAVASDSGDRYWFKLERRERARGGLSQRAFSRGNLADAPIATTSRLTIGEEEEEEEVERNTAELNEDQASQAATSDIQFSGLAELSLYGSDQGDTVEERCQDVMSRLDSPETDSHPHASGKQVEVAARPEETDRNRSNKSSTAMQVDNAPEEEERIRQEEAKKWPGSASAEHMLHEDAMEHETAADSMQTDDETVKDGRQRPGDLGMAGDSGEDEMDVDDVPVSSLPPSMPGTETHMSNGQAASSSKGKAQQLEAPAASGVAHVAPTRTPGIQASSNNNGQEAPLPPAPVRSSSRVKKPPVLPHAIAPPPQASSSRKKKQDLPEVIVKKPSVLPQAIAPPPQASSSRKKKQDLPEVIAPPPTELQPAKRRRSKGSKGSKAPNASKVPDSSNVPTAPNAPKASKKGAKAEGDRLEDNDDDQEEGPPLNPEGLSGGWSKLDPIDVDALFMWRPVSVKEFAAQTETKLSTSHVPQKHRAPRTLKAYGPRGEPHEFDPVFHFVEEHAKLRTFWDCIESHYVGGLPKHCTRPEDSMFEVMTEARFSELSPIEVQDLVRRKQVVLTDCAASRLNFDEDGLRTLHPLTSNVSIQGKQYRSVPQDHEDHVVKGTVQQLLDSARNPEGKILNALEFPFWHDSSETPSYASESVAWEHTRGQPGCSMQNPFPTGHIRWGLAATKNTITWLHLDSDGFGTYVKFLCGKKVWVVCRDRSGRIMGSIDIFTDDRYFLDLVEDNDYFEMEAVVMSEGCTLIMRPNTPHMVFGPEATICHGGHYYSTSTMEETACSLMHTFVCSDFITNISHHPSRLLLRRLAHFYHLGLVRRLIDRRCEKPTAVRLKNETNAQRIDPEFHHLPDVETFAGVLNLLSLCNLVILGNVLDHRTYSAPNQDEHVDATPEQRELMLKYDINDIPFEERHAIRYARGICLDIFRWFREHYEVVDSKTGTRVGDLPSLYLAKQAAALSRYKVAAERRQIKGAPHCESADLRRQLDNVLKLDSRTYRLVDNTKAKALDFGVDEGSYGVRVLRAPRPSTKHVDFLVLGTTAFDMNYMHSRIPLRVSGTNEEETSEENPNDDDDEDDDDEEEEEEEQEERPAKRARK